MNTASQWESLGTISIDSRISISDTSYFYDESLIVPSDSGDYVISVQYAMEDGHKHVAGLRVQKASTAPIRGRLLGSVPIDFGQIGICDRDAAERAFDALGDERLPEYQDQLNTTDLVAWIVVHAEVRMLIARPGFGDGMYPVYELIALDGKSAGIEIDCLQATLQ